MYVCVYVYESMCMYMYVYMYMKVCVCMASHPYVYSGAQRNVLRLFSHCAPSVFSFAAPEMLDDQKKGHSYEVDIWSMGVIL